MIERKKNSDWTRQSFLLPQSAIDDEQMRRRVLTSASYKFTDTTLGGNFAINAPPQFTRFADIKVGGATDIIFSRAAGLFQRVSDSGGFTSRRSPSRGMGRYYSEAIDDNGQHVVMRFGVPEFNSLVGFLGGMYDPAMSAIARTGRNVGLLYTGGQALGFLAALPFQPIILGGQVIRFFTESPTTKYYSMKPAMPLYWTAVNTMVNGIAINMGLTPRIFTPEQQKVIGNPNEPGEGENPASRYHQWLPDIISENGAIDMYAVATRAQRLAHRNNLDLIERLNRNLDAGNARNQLSENLRNYLSTDEPIRDAAPVKIVDYINAYAAITGNENLNEEGDNFTETMGNREKYNNESGGSSASEGSGWGNRFADFFEGERRDGSSFVTFRVDFSGTASESFSNSTREADLAQKMNSQSASARTTRINLAQGNIGDGMLATAAESVMQGAADVVAGFADQLQISGLVGVLAGSAFVDIPKVWDQSTANLPKMDYTIQLRSPYGNRYSRLQNLIVPMCMILAGALPLSTGSRSYTSPFICEAYCRGRAAIRLGMIDSISISRGEGNVGWNQDGEFLGVDITFSIVDLSSVLHMPVAAAFTSSTTAAGLAAAVSGAAGETAQQVVSGTLAAFSKSVYEEDNSYTDYMGVLGSLSWQDMVYVSNKWRLNMTRQMRTFESWRSPAHAANWFGGTLPGRVINAISLGTDRGQ